MFASVSRRAGKASTTVIFGLSVLALAVLGYFFWNTANDKSSDEVLLTHHIERADFQAFVTEPGDVASSSNVEIRCRVKSPGSAGTPILKVCEEGVNVKKGDFLLQFDDSHLQKEFLAQQIVVAKDEAAVIDAESELEKANQSLNEYRDGLFLVEKETNESELFKAESTLKSAQDSLVHANKMFRKGYVSARQLEAEQFAVEMAKKAERAARTKLRVLNEFTLDKMVSEAKAEIEKQKANVKAAKFTLELSQKRLKEVQDQIDYCTVKAPSAGQVVYANDLDWRGDASNVIEEGTLIRENKVVIRLPDLKHMQVDVKVNDAYVNRISPGQTALIELDADRDLVLKGKVKEVAAYPFPVRWHGAPIEYGVVVTIVDPPPTIRPGLRAKVKIIFDEKPDVLQAPVSAIVDHGDSKYVLVREDSDWRLQRITVGSNNNNVAVVTQGLSEGDEVSLTPFRFIDRSDLPEATPSKIAGQNDSNGSKQRPAPAS